MENEPIRHHYIPQFILRNFCIDELHYHVNYYDKKKQKTYVKETRDVFMERNLYRDSINNIENPTKIEKDLSKFENEVAKIIKDKFLNSKRIILTTEEHEKILLFFAIMGLRNKKTYEAFCTFSKSSIDIYSHWQKDKNMEDFWKRNLGYIVNCRTLNEVMTDKNIDQPFKIFMFRDVYGYAGKYVSVIEYKHNDLNFIIGDTYPMQILGLMDENPNSKFNISMYELFPISPNRMILIINNGVTGAPRSVLGLGFNVFDIPKRTNNNELLITVKSVFKRDVIFLNQTIYDGANKGIIYYRQK